MRVDGGGCVGIASRRPRGGDSGVDLLAWGRRPSLAGAAAATGRLGQVVAGECSSCLRSAVNEQFADADGAPVDGALARKTTMAQKLGRAPFAGVAMAKCPVRKRGETMKRPSFLGMILGAFS